MDQWRGTDQQRLRTGQYRDASNLDARFAIYAYGQPGPTLHELCGSLVEDVAEKSVLDVGCGPGGYAPTFGSAATYVGLDLSAGMLEESRARNGVICLAVADAQRLPIATRSFDVVLAMHMLYHVPDRALAIAEFARVLRDDGVILAVTNALDHQAETSDVIAQAHERVTGRAFSAKSVSANFPFEHAADELGAHFACTAHAMRNTLTVPTSEPVVAYIASMPEYAGIDDAATWEAFIAVVEELVVARIAREGAFRITASSGVVVGRRR